jgi:hypothetical protein
MAFVDILILIVAVIIIFCCCRLFGPYTSRFVIIKFVCVNEQEAGKETNFLAVEWKRT